MVPQAPTVRYGCEIPQRFHLGSCGLHEPYLGRPKRAVYFWTHSAGNGRRRGTAWVTKARVTVTLEDEQVEVGDGFLKSRDFEITQANCPWVSALQSYVKSEGTVLPKAVRVAQWAEA